MTFITMTLGKIIFENVNPNIAAYIGCTIYIILGLKELFSFFSRAWVEWKENKSSALTRDIVQEVPEGIELAVFGMSTMCEADLGDGSTESTESTASEAQQKKISSVDASKLHGDPFTRSPTNGDIESGNGSAELTECEQQERGESTSFEASKAHGNPLSPEFGSPSDGDIESGNGSAESTECEAQDGGESAKEGDKSTSVAAFKMHGNPLSLDSDSIGAHLAESAMSTNCDDDSGDGSADSAKRGPIQSESSDRGLPCVLEASTDVLSPPSYASHSVISALPTNYDVDSSNGFPESTEFVAQQKSADGGVLKFSSETILNQLFDSEEMKSTAMDPPVHSEEMKSTDMDPPVHSEEMKSTDMDPPVHSEEMKSTDMNVSNLTLGRLGVLPIEPVSLKEVFIIACSTSFTNVGSGVAAGLCGYSVIFVTFCAVLTNFVMMEIGQQTGFLLSKQALDEKYLTLFSGCVLVILGIADMATI